MRHHPPACGAGHERETPGQAAGPAGYAGLETLREDILAHCRRHTRDQEHRQRKIHTFPKDLCR